MAKKSTKTGGKAQPQNRPAVARGPGGRFAKGQSGNPGGRPKALAEVKALAAEHTKDAIDALHKIATTGKDERARVQAANSLLDRAWGKPTQAVEMSGPEGEAVKVETKPSPLGPEQVAELLHVLHEAGQLAPEGEESK